MAVQQESVGRHWLKVGESVLGHVATIALGFILMILGLALGVTMVLLPVGLVVGIVGVLLFVAGIFTRLNPDTES